VRGSEQISKKEKKNMTSQTMETRGREKKTTRIDRTRNAHLSKCAFADDLDRPEIPQTDLSPAEPQKLRLGARMPPDFSHPAVLWYASEGSIELSTSRATTTRLHDRAEINHVVMDTTNTSEQQVILPLETGTHRMFKSIAVSSAKR